MKPHPNDWICVTVQRRAVESRNTASVLQVLSEHVLSPMLAAGARGRLRVEFSGYNDDPRELWEIPQVRQFVRDLDAAFPYWFYVTDLRDDWLLIMAFCVCRTTVLKSGLTSIDNSDLAAFIDRQTEGLGALLTRHRLPTDLSRDIASEVQSFLLERRVLN